MMNSQDILDAVSSGESADREFKSAKGGFPASVWETYSAMANTDGGVIVLGIKELENGSCDIHGLDDVPKILKNFWNLINDRGKVNVNLLVNDDIEIVSVDGKEVLVVQVPRASRRQRPIFVGQNPLEGTYRRYNDGDYLCSRDEVGRMLADQSDQPADCEILPNFTLDDLDKKSLEQYRNRFASRSPAHPWLKLNDRELLEKLGGWRTDRNNGEDGLTVAGLLMFGQDEAIRDPAGIPQYQIDYRERVSDDPQVRWTDRIWPDGTWVANLFQFFERAYPRLVIDLKIPFQFAALRLGETTTTPQPDLFQRHDETIVHEAIREAFVNSLVHADFRGKGGIIIERYRDRLEFSNPGTLLLGIEQMLKGGVSECRNKSLQRMFAMLGYGEKAGSGIDKIRQGWAAQKWRWPIIQEQHLPDRVQLVLPMVSLLPENSLARLRDVLGKDFAALNGHEVQALVTADVEGSVTNSRLQLISAEHPIELTKILQGLALKGFLEQIGQKKGSSYRLPAWASPLVSGASPLASGASPLALGASPLALGASPLALENDPRLLELGKSARDKKKLSPSLIKTIILQLCSGHYLTAEQLGSLMDRSKDKLQENFLASMVAGGVLQLRFPEQPTHPEQAYRTNPEGNAR